MSKNYQLTLNKIEEYDDVLNYLLELKSIQYLVAAQEKAPKTGHDHIHIYIQLKYSQKLSKKRLKSAHIESCKGSPQQNEAYVKKNGNILIEKGELHKTGKLTIKDIKQMEDKDLDELGFIYYNKVQQLKKDKLNLIHAGEYFKDVKICYIYGPSGVGKTKCAIEKINELYKNKKIENDVFNEVKYTGGFWNGVSIDNMSEIALYDDFRDYHMPASEFINFIDYNCHIMNIKYGHVVIKFKYIFITSIQSPDELYQNDYHLKNGEILFASNKESNNEPKVQWKRRITETIHLQFPFPTLPNITITNLTLNK